MTDAKIDFFHITMPEQSRRTFGSLIEEVMRRPVGRQRNHPVRNHFIRLQDAHHSRGQFEGDVVRIRMDELPIRADLEGNVVPLDLADDEGIGEQTAFLYDERSSYLVLHRHRYGVSAGMLVSYFEALARLPVPVEWEPALQRGARERMENMDVIKRFEVAFAAPSDPAELRRRGGGLDDILNFQESAESPRISVVLSMDRGRRRGSLNTERIFDTVRRVLRRAEQSPESVERLRVRGIDLDEDHPKAQVVDLLADRMREEVPIPEHAGRRLEYPVRRALVRDAWNRRREEILADI